MIFIFTNISSDFALEKVINFIVKINILHSYVKLIIII